MASEGLVVVSGSFAAPGQSSTFNLFGVYNLFIYGGFTGSVQLERSFNDGADWVPVSASQLGAPAVYTSDMSLSFQEIETGMLYRLNCTACAVGPINYRVSQGIYRLRF